MKKHVRPFAATILAACMLLTSCNSGGTTTTTGDTSEGAPETADYTTESESTGSNEGASELLDALDKAEGELSQPRSSYISYPIEGGEDITLTYWLELSSNVANGSESMNETAFAEYFQEELGVNIEYKHPSLGNHLEEFGLLMASTTLPDIVEWEWTKTYTGGVGAALADGLATDISEYVQPNGAAADLWQYLEDNPSIAKQVKTDDGVYYAFPFIRGSKYLQTTSGPMLRADLLEQTGLDAPVTIDDWTEVLRAFKDMGIEKPLSFEKTENLETFSMPAYGLRQGGMFVDAEEGTVKYSYEQDSAKDWLKTLNLWYSEGLLDNEYLTMDRSTMDAYMLSGKSAATYGAGGGYMGTYLASDATEEGYDLLATNFAVLNAGDIVEYGGTSYEYATTSRANAAITEDCQYPEIAAMVLNYAYTEKGYYTVNFGREGISYNFNSDGSVSYTDEVMNNDSMSVAVAMAHYGRANTSGAFVQSEDYIFEYYAYDQQKEALLTWGENESQKTLMPPVSVSTEESNEYTGIMADIDTYVKASVASFINGSMDIDAEFDTFVENLHSMNLDRAIEIYQIALDRYNAR